MAEYPRARGCDWPSDSRPVATKLRAACILSYLCSTVRHKKNREGRPKHLLWNPVGETRHLPAELGVYSHGHVPSAFRRSAGRNQRNARPHGIGGHRADDFRPFAGHAPACHGRLGDSSRHVAGQTNAAWRQGHPQACPAFRLSAAPHGRQRGRTGHRTIAAGPALRRSRLERITFQSRRSGLPAQPAMVARRDDRHWRCLETS